MTDAELAAGLAEAAGSLLMDLRRHRLLSARALGAAGDSIANTLIMSALKEARPDDGLLSEETADSAERLERSRVWIVDPLDGTREYAEGRDDWAVHVALSIDGRPAVGAVALPAKGLVYRSDAPHTRKPPASRPRLLVSRTRPPPLAEAVAEALDAEMVPMGSAGAKVMAVLSGEGDIYLHAGGQYEWDNCAPAAVALAAGLHASRIDGAALYYNARKPYLPDIVVCHPEAAGALMKVIGQALAA